MQQLLKNAVMYLALAYSTYQVLARCGLDVDLSHISLLDGTVPYVCRLVTRSANDSVMCFMSNT
jgi:hypothetical protein